MNKIEQLDLLTELLAKLENLNLLIDQQAGTIYVPEHGRTPVVIVNDLMKEQVIQAIECAEALKKDLKGEN